jgi:predicted ester cyclase
MRWRLTFTRAGLPDLEVEGEHLTVYHDGAIALIEEHVAPAAERRVEDYLATHGPALRPAGSAFAPPAALEHKRIRRALLRSSVRAYAAAKSQQDAAGALAGCAPEFAIETIPFGFDTGDRASTAGQLAMFFEAFPDYRAETEGMAVQGDQVAWWGTVSLTSGGPLLGLPPTGRRTALPAFGVFDFHGSDLVRERFHFDLAQLCEGLGLPMGEVVARLEPMRDRPAA